MSVLPADECGKELHRRGILDVPTPITGKDEKEDRRKGRTSAARRWRTSSGIIGERSSYK